MKNTHSTRGVYLALVVSSGGYSEGGWVCGGESLGDWGSAAVGSDCVQGLWILVLLLVGIPFRWP